MTEAISLSLKQSTVVKRLAYCRIWNATTQPFCTATPARQGTTTSALRIALLAACVRASVRDAGRVLAFFSSFLIS